MELSSRWMLTLSALALGVALLLAVTAPSAQPNTLTAKVVSGRGLQGGSTEVSLRALYHPE